MKFVLLLLCLVYVVELDATSPLKYGTKCWAARKRAQSPFLADAPVPDCRSDGSYKSIQCHVNPFFYAQGESCWCVNRITGKQIPGSTASGRKNVNCNKQKTNCWTARKRAQSPFLMDAHVPDCKSDGSYKSVQCYVNPFVYSQRESCWCVNQITGKQIPGSTANGRKNINCDRYQIYYDENDDDDVYDEGDVNDEGDVDDEDDVDDEGNVYDEYLDIYVD